MFCLRLVGQSIGRGYVRSGLLGQPMSPALPGATYRRVYSLLNPHVPVVIVVHYVQSISSLFRPSLLFLQPLAFLALFLGLIPVPPMLSSAVVIVIIRVPVSVSLVMRGVGFVGM